jgi:hypothetical protein
MKKISVICALLSVLCIGFADAVAPKKAEIPKIEPANEITEEQEACLSENPCAKGLSEMMQRACARGAYHKCGIAIKKIEKPKNQKPKSEKSKKAKSAAKKEFKTKEEFEAYRAEKKKQYEEWMKTATPEEIAKREENRKKMIKNLEKAYQENPNAKPEDILKKAREE